jgi:hypothetical protein
MVKPTIHQQKALLCIWWKRARIVHYKPLPPGQTIIEEVYLAQLQQVYDALLQKQPVLVNHKGVVSLQDNARPHAM